MSDLVRRAAARLREVLPSFTDPRHYSNHDDIALVRDLEAYADSCDSLAPEGETAPSASAAQEEQSSFFCGAITQVEVGRRWQRCLEDPEHRGPHWRNAEPIYCDCKAERRVFCHVPDHSLPDVCPECGQPFNPPLMRAPLPRYEFVHGACHPQLFAARYARVVERRIDGTYWKDGR